MASLPLVSCFSVIVLALCSSVVEPHIIGGGWNTDLDEDDSTALNTALLRSVLSPLKSSRFHDNLPSRPNVDAKIASETKDKGETKVDFIENTSDQRVARAGQISGVKLRPPAMSGLVQANPFFRQKRQDCQIPDNLGLNNTRFVGRNSSQSSRPIIPPNQPGVCPSKDNPWWPRPEPNLGAACPWKLSELDLGERAYPRYILQANCLCTACINSPSMRCMELRQEMTYFEHRGCQDGLAIMVKKTINIVVG